MYKQIIFLSFLLIAISILFCGNLLAESVMGTVLDRSSTPVPGIKVILYHPVMGESKPRYTNRDGVFYFPDVPRHRISYDIEFYWRGQLVYRNRVSVNASKTLRPVILR